MKSLGNVVGTVNVLTLVASVPAVVVALVLYLRHGGRAPTLCEHWAEQALLALSCTVMLLSAAALLGAWCGMRWLLRLYVAGMAVIVVALALFCAATFAASVTSGNPALDVGIPGAKVKDYTARRFSPLLRSAVSKTGLWRAAVDCLRQEHVCDAFAADRLYFSFSKFLATPSSPAESGCCKPPISCGFVYVNATNWQELPQLDEKAEVWCNEWSNDVERLCYECESCEGGIMAMATQYWLKAAYAVVGLLGLLLLLFLIACCAVSSPKPPPPTQKPLVVLKPDYYV